MTALNLFVPRVIQSVVDNGIARGEIGSIVRSSLILLSLGLGSAILAFIQRYLTEWIAARVGYDLRNRMFNHIQHLPFTYHDHTQSGKLISRCIEDVRAIEKFAGGAVADLVKFVMLAAGVVRPRTLNPIERPGSRDPGLSIPGNPLKRPRAGSRQGTRRREQWPGGADRPDAGES